MLPLPPVPALTIHGTQGVSVRAPRAALRGRHSLVSDNPGKSLEGGAYWVRLGGAGGCHRRCSIIVQVRHFVVVYVLWFCLSPTGGKLKDGLGTGVCVESGGLHCLCTTHAVGIPG